MIWFCAKRKRVVKHSLEEILDEIKMMEYNGWEQYGSMKYGINIFVQEMVKRRGIRNIWRKLTR